MIYDKFEVLSGSRLIFFSDDNDLNVYTCLVFYSATSFSVVIALPVKIFNFLQGVATQLANGGPNPDFLNADPGLQ